MSDLRMPDINHVQIAGRLTRDPELKYLGQGGIPVCKMSLAVSRTYKANGEKREETLFVDVTAWRQTAEYCGEKLKKGRPVLVEGRLKSDEWEDKATGAKRTKIEVQADRVQVLDWDGEKGQGTPVDRNAAAAEDDIPF